MRDINTPGFDRVVDVSHPPSGLRAIVSMHNGKLGPRVGGLRVLPYATFEQALTDVNRLAQGMSYKSALAGIGFGGGKSVIISKSVTPEMLRIYAAVLNELKGDYVCAEDVGSTPKDITFIGQFTPYATGLSHAKSSGNPSPFTAQGVFRAIQAACETLYGTPSVEGKTVAIQGLGSVGADLAGILFWHKAKLIVSDIDSEKTAAVVAKYKATPCSPETIHRQECDIFSPCALGAILNPTTIPELRCKIVAGCANNQLLSDIDGLELHERGILYAPDFAGNAGGIINISSELNQTGYNPLAARDAVLRIYDTMKTIFTLAEKTGSTTHEAAVDLAQQRISSGEGRRIDPPYFHHYHNLKA
jgi:leucine dehydrogenase